MTGHVSDLSQYADSVDAVPIIQMLCCQRSAGVLLNEYVSYFRGN